MKILAGYNIVTECGSNSVVECLLAKEDVASSNLVSRSIKKRVFALFFYKYSYKETHGFGMSDIKYLSN